MRWCKQLDAQGTESFYQLRAVRDATVLNVETSAECQLLLDEGHSIAIHFCHPETGHCLIYQFT